MPIRAGGLGDNHQYFVIREPAFVCHVHSVGVIQVGSSIDGIPTTEEVEEKQVSPPSQGLLRKTAGRQYNIFKPKTVVGHSWATNPDKCDDWTPRQEYIHVVEAGKAERGLQDDITDEVFEPYLPIGSDSSDFG